MSFLASLRPLLRGSASVSITLAPAANDGLSILIQPKLEKFDADTSDAARAALQAALARPVRLVIPSDADVDAEFVAALTRVNDARAPVSDDLQRYLDGLAQAQQSAKIEAGKSAAKAKGSTAKPSTTPTKPAAPTESSASESTDDANDDDEAQDGNEASAVAPSEASAQDAVSPASAVPGAASTLFD